jgi:polar amino acid transport system ATP-binding protein
MIEIQHLSKSFDGTPVLKDISERIAPGEVVSVIGPSGTGKSTLLRCLNLLERPDGGRILIDGEDLLAPKAHVPRIRRKMGMVFQSFNLFPHLTVMENLTVGPVKLLKTSRQTATQRGRELLHMVGLAEKENNMPAELSGGQQQRVAIARCLSMNPKIILFDEPTSSLDPTMVSEVLAVIRRLARDGMTMMIVTHELNFARDVSNRVLYMDDGTIYESGPPRLIMDAPQKDKTRAFINRLRNFVRLVDNPDYDPYALKGEIELFCDKHFFGPIMTERALLAVEETLGLYFSRPEHRAITLTLSYAEKSGELTLLFDDRNPPCNFLEVAVTEDRIGSTLLRGITHDTVYQRTEKGNRISMVLNEST